MSDDGMVTAETALLMPVLVVLGWLLTVGVIAGAWQVRLEDAARGAARALALGVAEVDVRTRIEQHLPGTSMDVQAEGDLVRARVHRVLGPVGPMPAVTLTADAVGMREP